MTMYAVTLKIDPLDREHNKFLKTFNVDNDTDDEDDLLDKIAGFPNSPMQKIMDELDIVAIYDYDVKKIVDIKQRKQELKLARIQKKEARKNVSKGIDVIHAKPYSHPDHYGYWIEGDGELTDVIGRCRHGTDHDLGRIAIVTYDPGQFVFRFDRRTVSKEALIKLLDVIRRSHYCKYHSMWRMTDDETSRNERSFKTKAEAMSAIRAVIPKAKTLEEVKKDYYY